MVTTVRIANADERPMTDRAMFGAGCFWAVEAALRLAGVDGTRVGFSGGTVAHPSYAQVATGQTGHAQVVLIEYDPQMVSYEALLEVFWRMHDATQVDRQGPDVGPQYRSVIFYFDEDQRRAAEASRRDQEAWGVHDGPIRTEIVPAGRFWPAEEEHQRYYEQRGRMAKSLFAR